MPTTETQPIPPRDTDGSADSVMATLADICLQDGIRSSIFWKDGKVRWRGPETQRVYNAWSCTKSFTSVCAGLMVDAGKLALDEPIVRWLPEFSEHYPTVTLRNLLSLTSGFQCVENDPFQLTAPRFAPGRHLHYTVEAEWISLAVTRVSGQTLSELFMERIGNPIGMDPESFLWKSAPGPQGETVNGGSGALLRGIFTNAENLLLFGQLMLQRGAWGGQQLISTAWLDETQSSQQMGHVPPWSTEPGIGWYHKSLPGTYGLHWWVNGKRLDGRQLWPSAPSTTFAAQGNLNQICLVIPEWNSVLVRMGADGVIDMDGYDKVLEEIRTSYELSAPTNSQTTVS